MKIAIFANTPAQVYFYKNIIKKLEEHGHQVKLLVRDYGETIAVVSELKLDCMVYSNPKSSKLSKLLSLPYDVLQAYKELRKFKPDIVTGMGVYDAFTAFLLRAKCIEFEDSEPNANKISYSIQFKLYLPFVDAIITPESFRDDLGKKQIRINSFKELAYLHPNYYRPDESIKGLLGLKGNEEYVLLRFNAFDAMHDLGIAGFKDSDKVRLVRELEKYAKIFISSEAGVPDEIKDCVMKIPKSRIHDGIYYAKLLVADTGTMVTEAACLGTPAIMLHSSVKKFGNFVELENKYELIFGYDQGSNEAIERAVELIKKQNLNDEWKAKRERLLKDKIDITAFMVWFIEDWPESARIIRDNPDYQEIFNEQVPRLAGRQEVRALSYS